ncbi:MAG: 50S ribosomal protein L15 [SAR86 cluster bacterium]|jgi:large subunit ribosomal protein L15|uniref:Large ribosomal subunit protein uL15 n=1 Tax=SAR86 cluster bacterium TaxID=2030880 RepID=A0A520MX33_9GAMM|nr:MAG: 50S ribosomal protein L15 [Gammaproteobacteria bacterium TMED225]RZO25775.1 MAG: 50S ribosomal protein L15 [SAR86 cluster bacterium]|tara:strand:+ start:1561 stop:2067 length:507 start_codon:yes stop_codon:yes gene_type:complete
MNEQSKNSMKLNTISSEGTSQQRKRVGRGIGSGLGKTAGRGHKGQKSRSGGNIRLGFEGGQMPLQMRLPKFGFSSRVNRSFKEVNIKNLNGMKVVNLDTLKEKKLISKSIKKVKIFGDAPIDSKIIVEGINVSKGAKKSIENAGGKIVEIEPKIMEEKSLTENESEEK